MEEPTILPHGVGEVEAEIEGNMRAISLYVQFSTAREAADEYTFVLVFQD